MPDKNDLLPAGYCSPKQRFPNRSYRSCVLCASDPFFYFIFLSLYLFFCHRFQFWILELNEWIGIVGACLDINSFQLNDDFLKCLRFSLFVCPMEWNEIICTDEIDFLFWRQSLRLWIASGRRYPNEWFQNKKCITSFRIKRITFGWISFFKKKKKTERNCATMWRKIATGWICILRNMFQR